MYLPPDASERNKPQLICIMYLPSDASERNTPQLICIMYLPPDASERNKPRTSFHCFVWFCCGIDASIVTISISPACHCQIVPSPLFFQQSHTHTESHTHTICACVVDIQTGNEQVHGVGVFVYRVAGKAFHLSSPAVLHSTAVDQPWGGGGGGG